MIEKNILERRLRALEEYLRDLEETSNKINWNSFVEDKIIRRYVERTLQMAVEACLDIANHIISYEGYREPVDNKDTFSVLAENNIIYENLSENLKRMAKFRNIVVHDYLSVDPEIVYSILNKHLADISTFANTVKNSFLEGYN